MDQGSNPGEAPASSTDGLAGSFPQIFVDKVESDSIIERAFALGLETKLNK